MSSTPSKTKASRISSDDQVLFLLSCIRNAIGGGKIDFANVAKECDIVTRGAAAKRYERLLKAHNINAAGGSTLPTTPNKNNNNNGNNENTDEDDADAPEAGGARGAGRGRKRKGSAAAATSGRKGKSIRTSTTDETKRDMMKKRAVASPHAMVGMENSGDEMVKEEDVDEDEEDMMAVKEEEQDEADADSDEDDGESVA